MNNINSSSKTVRFERADGIRGLACLIVLITHAVSVFYINAAKYVAGTGKIGVWLFFVLSAFLLTCKFEATGFRIGAISRYILGRVLRILPLFAIAIVTYRLLGTAGIDSWKDVSDCLLFNRDFVHLWTIPVEFKFYIWLPILAFVLTRTKQRWGITGLFLAFALLLFFHQLFWPYRMTQINSIETIWYLPCFGFGIALAALNFTTNIPSALENLLYLVIALCLIIITPGARHFIFALPFDNSLSNKFIFVGSLWSAFIFCVMRGKGFISKLMQTKFLKTLGNSSYSIYLFHWLIYIRLAKLYPNNGFVMFIAFLAAIFVGIVIYRFCERPMEKLRHDIMNYLPTTKNKIDRYSCESEKV